MRHTNLRAFASHNFCERRKKTTQEIHVLVINVLDIVETKITFFLSLDDGRESCHRLEWDVFDLNLIVRIGGRIILHGR